MAYGSADADLAATTTDNWLNEGTNAIDLFATHNPILAIMLDQSEQPGGEYQFRQGQGATGGKFRTAAYGKPASTAAGVTKANQINAISAALPVFLTDAFWNYAHYQAVAFYDYRTQQNNSGPERRIDIGEAIMRSLQSSFYSEVGTDLTDGVVDSEDKILAFDAALLNTGVVGGIDQSDTANNLWWNAVKDTTAGTVNTQDIDKAILDATLDTGIQTGIMRQSPDVILTTNTLSAKLMQDLKQAQRVEVQTMLRGGARYMDYAGCRVFNTTRITAGYVMGINSTVWDFRYNTKAPDPVTPGWVPVDRTPAMMQRSYNWMLGLGCRSPKHNFLLTGRTA